MIVMVVDPDKEHLMKTKSYLVRDGTEVVTFCDAMEAVQYGYNHDVDAVFTEVVMPHISGQDVVNLLHKHNPAIRACFLTDTDKYLEAGRECKIFGYYLKPIGDGLNLLHGEAATG